MGFKVNNKAMVINKNLLADPTVENIRIVQNDPTGVIPVTNEVVVSGASFIDGLLAAASRGAFNQSAVEQTVLTLMRDGEVEFEFDHSDENVIDGMAQAVAETVEMIRMMGSLVGMNESEVESEVERIKESAIDKLKTIGINVDGFDTITPDAIIGISNNLVEPDFTV